MAKKRVLKVPEPLLDELQLFLDGVYLFDNKGKSYSRQWGFRQLEAFLIEKATKTFRHNRFVSSIF